MTMTNAELAKRIEELAKEATPGPWKHSEQDGVPGHCFTAQLWDSNGKCLAVIEPTDDEATASSNAALITELVNNLPAIISALRGRESVIEDCARIVETTLEQMPHADYGPWARMAITLAARAVRRGRHLTAAEKLANLQRALDETDEEPQDEAALASTSQVMEGMSAAAQDVLAERRRQVEAKGWTPEHDDGHDHSEMALAAACYAMPPSARRLVMPNGTTVQHRLWPWGREWWKPKSRREDLVRACALGIAEIERLDRAMIKAAGGGG